MALVMAAGLKGDTAAFDLAGPAVEVKVTRGGRTLPVAEAPELEAGDRVWLRPVMPEGQSARYLLVTVFLQGPTNPPPEDWFTRAECWNKEVRAHGVTVTVPEGAQQALLFLAPETGGDFRTLRATVRGKPGVFVRVSQDLNQASRDRMRLNRYLSELKKGAGEDEKALHERAVLTARSLNIKLDSQCFDKPSEQQAPCLMQNLDQMVLDDGQHQTMVASLTSGAASDLITQLTVTPTAGAGYFSPYVGAFIDLARLLDSFRTAQYQYSPALGLAEGDKLGLRLNNAPSFRKPETVLAAALPPVGDRGLPVMRAPEGKREYCMDKPELVLPVEGAPLVYGTEMGHDFMLRVQMKTGQTVELPAKPEPGKGGFAIDTKGLPGGGVDAGVGGVLKGSWGYEEFEGPSFRLRSAQAGGWTVKDKTALVVGRTDTLRLEGAGAACVERVELKDGAGKAIGTTWRAAEGEGIDVEAKLKDMAPGPVTVEVKQYGLKEADEVRLRAYAEAGKLKQFTLHAGDRVGVLEGTRLDEVARLELKGVEFRPGVLERVGGEDELKMAAEGTAGGLGPETGLTAQATLKDGRTEEAPAVVGEARPRLKLLSKSVDRAGAGQAIRLGDSEELPLSGKLTFFVKSEGAPFARTEKIEVGTEDGALRVMLGVGDGSLVMQDASTVRGVLDPMKSFGASGFGPLRFRAVRGDGVEGEWQGLATLVRLPELKEVRCPDSADKPCELVGTELFLIDSVAADPRFQTAVAVPEGFSGTSLSVPRPNGTLLYLKLRDDAAAVNTAVLAVLPEP